jgi:protein-disulfide isomerase
MTEIPRRGRPRVVGVVVLGVCAAILLFVIASLSLDKGDESKIEITGNSEVQELLGGIPQEGAVLGSPDAAVTVQVFNDLQCDPCSEWQRRTIDPLISGPVRDGDLKLEFHHFPMSQSGFGLASFGSVAAGKQDEEWQFNELFLINQEEAKRKGADQDFLDRIAAAITIFNVEQWQNDMDDEDVQKTLEEDDQLAAERRFPAEPAVVVDGPTGTRELINSPTTAEIQGAVGQVG